MGSVAVGKSQELKPRPVCWLNREAQAPPLQRNAKSPSLRLLFHFGGFYHRDCIPGAAVEEAAVGTFAEALFAADAENGIDRDAAEWSAVFVRDPEHAVFHRTVFHARRRAGASGATFGDDGEFLRLLFCEAWSGPWTSVPT